MQDRLFEFLQRDKKVELLIVKDDKDAKKAQDVCDFLGFNSFTLSDFRAVSGDDLRSYQEELNHLLMALNNFYRSRKAILISPIRTIIHKLPIERLFTQEKLSFGDRIDINSFKEKLLYLGYTFVDIVEQRGEVSFHQNIFDIFPIDAENPYRISLLDNEIESIKEFIIETQKSLPRELEEVRIIPALFSLSREEYQQISKECREGKSNSFFKDIHSLGLWHLGDLSIHYTKIFNSFFVNDLSKEIEEIKSFLKEDIDELFIDIPILPPSKEYHQIEVTDFNQLLSFHKNKSITLIAKNQVAIKRANIQQKLLKDVKIVEKDIILNLISNRELILSVNREEKKKSKSKKSSIIIDDLKKGDLVVHQNYGVGIFQGLEQRRVLGATKDFVVIKYQGDDKLLLPVENLTQIDRYISNSGNMEIIDKLGKSSFQRLKAKVKEKLFLIAQEIVDISAKRELTQTPKIEIDYEEILFFQSKADFEYTKDQKSAIDEILKDFKSQKPMDRLLSGDVGFGKTEVAMNAIFAIVKSGFSALLIAPTTLLTSQHYKTLKERFKEFNFRIAKLDRFTKPKEKKSILEALKKGEIDICIGTHTLLNLEVKNLAFIVIDEEHKFGVKQKEKLKSLRNSLHILSMSATPIPRSLNLALSSLKSYSTLTTPPNDRKGVRTFVKEYNPILLKEVILRELRRGGQIFFIHNRIDTIEEKKNELLEILPNLKILVLHSKISPVKTENEMLKFENGEYDLLLSTSIIESGIHIPNVNTIIIEGADRFGIADLHQLRGRVGREKREGFCYYLVEDKEKLSEEAKKRLIALEKNSFLGSGAVLAHHDLEIRGGGNIIGEAQSGHIKNIGYNLYLKMLEESINKLLNRGKIEEKEIDIKLSIDAYLNENYIKEDRIRLELYRRLSRCRELEEIYDIEEEMIDRFGEMDEITKQFLQLITIKILAHKKDIKTITNYNQNITFIYQNDKKEIFKSRSKDDDDLIEAVIKKLRA